MSDKVPEDRNSFFVSRRGRQVGVHEVDLKDIDIERDDQAESSGAPISPKQESKRAKFPRGHVSISRKKLLIFAAVIGVLLLSPVIIGEIVAAQYRTGVVSAKDDLSSVVTSQVIPMQKKTTISADQLRTTGSQIEGISTRMCRGGLLDNIAMLYPRADTSLKACKVEQVNYSSLAANVYRMEGEARYLEKLGAALKPVSSPITNEYAVISSQLSTWQAASDAVGKLSPPEAMRSAHNELLTHVKAVATAWSTLNTANNDQDGAAFTEAEKTLASEYEAVRATSDQFSSIIADTQAKLSANYNDLK